MVVLLTLLATAFHCGLLFSPLWMITTIKRLSTEKERTASAEFFFKWLFLSNTAPALAIIYLFV